VNIQNSRLRQPLLPQVQHVVLHSLSKRVDKPCTLSDTRSCLPRCDGDRGEFTLRSGTTIAYINTEVAPIVERFCLEVTRRTGLRLLPMAGDPGSNEPSVRIELATGANSERSLHRWDLAMGDGPRDERL
jgi:hypothetical protein